MPPPAGTAADLAPAARSASRAHTRAASVQERKWSGIGCFPPTKFERVTRPAVPQVTHLKIPTRAAGGTSSEPAHKKRRRHARRKNGVRSNQRGSQSVRRSDSQVSQSISPMERVRDTKQKIKRANEIVDTVAVAPLPEGDPPRPWITMERNTTDPSVANNDSSVGDRGLDRRARSSPRSAASNIQTIRCRSRSLIEIAISMFRSRCFDLF